MAVVHGAEKFADSSYATVGAITRVPVDTQGEPPVISFNPAYLADALEIGFTLHLVDHLNPGMTTDPSGSFCVIMNLRSQVAGAAASNPAGIMAGSALAA